MGYVFDCSGHLEDGNKLINLRYGIWLGPFFFNSKVTLVKKYSDIQKKVYKTNKKNFTTKNTETSLKI